MDIVTLIPHFGNFLWTVVAFVVALSIIVTIHELGHYLVGRWSGIAAEVFSVGFGPVLFSRVDRHGTRWQLALLPVGGYVKFLGDSGAASGRDDEALAHMDDKTLRRTVHGAPLWARTATVAAGPVFNFILSVAIFAGVMMVEGVARMPLTVAELRPVPGAAADGLRPGDTILAVDGRAVPDAAGWSDFFEALPEAAELTYTVERDGGTREVQGPQILPPLIAAVTPDSAAEAVGLEPGDTILAVDGSPVASFRQLSDSVIASDGRPILLKVWRGDAEIDFTLVPRRTDLPKQDGGFETRYLIGVTGAMLFEPETRTPGPWEALRYGAERTWWVIDSSVSGLYHMAAGKISSCNLRGPIGIAETSGSAASQGLTSFIWFIAVLSAAVGFLNLLPVPILDGGHLVFFAYEALAGRAPGDRALKVMMSIGLILLIALMSFAVTNDIRC